MLLNRSSLMSFVKLVSALALVVAGARSAAVEQLRVRGPAALQGQEITFTSPQFKVEALWFKSNDETNWAWQGSDEVYAVFADMDPTHADHVTSVYGNVDEGDTETFRPGDRCMAPLPKCETGMAELNVRFSLWESDYWKYFDFCPGTFPGLHNILEGGRCTGDDLIGRGSIIHSRDDLVAMLPSVGASREFTHVMDDDAGIYRLRYRITRLADAERSIVIHLPPLDPTTPPGITLQGAAVTVNGIKYARLTWSGATTSSVDLYRNGAKLLVTPNDGSHDDGVLPGTYQYRVCNLNITSGCSPDVSVTVP